MYKAYVYIVCICVRLSNLISFNRLTVNLKECYNSYGCSPNITYYHIIVRVFDNTQYSESTQVPTAGRDFINFLIIKAIWLLSYYSSLPTCKTEKRTIPCILQWPHIPCDTNLFCCETWRVADGRTLKLNFR